MAGETKAAGVGEALAVKHEDVRLDRELAGGGDQRGGLAEAEQAGDVGKSDGPTGKGRVDHRLGLDVPDDPTGDDVLAIRSEGGVRACHKPGGFAKRDLLDLRGEAFLEANRLLWCQVPAVPCPGEFHQVDNPDRE